MALRERHYELITLAIANIVGTLRPVMGAYEEGGWVDEFADELRTVIDAAVEKLSDARGVVDEHGVQVYTERVRYLLAVAERHGVDTASMSAVRDLHHSCDE